MRELNFRSSKKNYLPVVFEDNTKILVKTPTKGLVERLATLSESLGELEHSANGDAWQFGRRHGKYRSH